MAVPFLAFLLLFASTWAEAWSDLAAWAPITQACFTPQAGSVSATCQSGGLRSLRTWDPTRPIRATFGQVCGQPAMGSSTNRYWAGVNLWQSDSKYVGLATERTVPPFQADPNPEIVSLNPAGKVLAPGQVGGCHDFRLDYDPTQRGNKRGIGLFVDGVLLQFWRVTFDQPVRLMLVCASVGEATPDDGSAAQCSFGPVSVSQ